MGTGDKREEGRSLSLGVSVTDVFSVFARVEYR